MVFNVELLAEAEDELDEAFGWYEKQQFGLGDRFYKEVDHHLSLLEKRPVAVHNQV